MLINGDALSWSWSFLILHLSAAILLSPPRWLAAPAPREVLTCVDGLQLSFHRPKQGLRRTSPDRRCRGGESVCTRRTGSSFIERAARSHARYGMAWLPFSEAFVCAVPRSISPCIDCRGSVCREYRRTCTICTVLDVQQREQTCPSTYQLRVLLRPLKRACERVAFPGAYSFIQQPIKNSSTEFARKANQEPRHPLTLN